MGSIRRTTPTTMENDQVEVIRSSPLILNIQKTMQQLALSGERLYRINESLKHDQRLLIESKRAIAESRMILLDTKPVIFPD